MRRNVLRRSWRRVSGMKWVGHVDRMGDENWQRDQMPRKRKEMEVRQTENAMGTALREIWIV